MICLLLTGSQQQQSHRGVDLEGDRQYVVRQRLGLQVFVLRQAINKALNLDIHVMFYFSLFRWISETNPYSRSSIHLNKTTHKHEDISLSKCQYGLAVQVQKV